MLTRIWVFDDPEMNFFNKRIDERKPKMQSENVFRSGRPARFNYICLTK